MATSDAIAISTVTNRQECGLIHFHFLLPYTYSENSGKSYNQGSIEAEFPQGVRGAMVHI